MIGSWRGFAVAAALAVVLWAIVGIDAARAPGVVDRTLVPGLDLARISELIWQRTGEPARRVVRSGERWMLAAAGPTGAAVPADPAAIGEVLAALRGGRWHRRGPALPVDATLTVVAGDARHVLGLAAPIAGTEQRWLVVDGHGAVVDRWIARALDRDPLRLQIGRPLAEAAAALAVTIRAPDAGVLRLVGSPRRMVQPIALWLRPELADELERALRAIVVVRAMVRIPDGASGAHGLAIELAATGGRDPVSVVLGGACPGAPELVAASGSAGDGCVERAAADAAWRAVARLRAGSGELVERRPIPFEPHRITLGDGAVLALAPPRLGEAAADPVRVAELLAALAAPAEVAALPAGPPSGQLVVADRASTAVTLDLYPGRVLVRRGEPVALAPAPGAWALLGRASRELRDRTLWREEPTTIARIDVDGVRYQRGSVIGAWTREPAGAVDATRVEALATRLAAPEALGWLDAAARARFAAAHRVTLTVAPPAGPPIVHALELGAPGPAGCPVRAGGQAAVLPAALCRELAALAAP